MNIPDGPVVRFRQIRLLIMQLQVAQFSCAVFTLKWTQNGYDGDPVDMSGKTAARHHHRPATGLLIGNQLR
jgi:hypothetical protein